jgi:hypothetical protein
MTPEAVEGTNIRTWIGLLRGVDSTGVFNLSGDYWHLAIKRALCSGQFSRNLKQLREKLVEMQTNLDKKSSNESLDVE